MRSSRASAARCPLVTSQRAGFQKSLPTRKRPPPPHRAEPLPSRQGGGGKHTQRDRVWAQCFLSVMKKAIINRLNAKLHSRYAKKRQKFFFRGVSSLPTRKALQRGVSIRLPASSERARFIQKTAVSLFLKSGHGNKCESSPPTPLQYLLTKLSCHLPPSRLNKG